jgi:hypothetical protein
MSPKISSEWNVVAPLADDFAMQILALPHFTVQPARTLPARSPSCLTELARQNGGKDSANNWRWARW